MTDELVERRKHLFPMTMVVGAFYIVFLAQFPDSPSWKALIATWSGLTAHHLSEILRQKYMVANEGATS